MKLCECGQPVALITERGAWCSEECESKRAVSVETGEKMEFTNMTADQIIKSILSRYEV